MKYFYLIILLFCVGFIYAQDEVTCIPDSILLETEAVAIPLPYDSINRPDGGIQDTAYLNQYFETTISVNIPSSISGIPINTVTLDPEEAIENLPEGLDYVCNPPSCEFPTAQVNCLKIFGTPTNPEDTLEPHDLVITFTIRILGIPTNIKFPGGDQLPEDATGNYFLFVRGGDMVSSVNGYFDDKLDIRVRPNPLRDQGVVQINASISEQLTFSLYDLTGKVIHAQPINLQNGLNEIQLDGSFLPNGMYVYTLANENGVISDKLIVNRN